MRGCPGRGAPYGVHAPGVTRAMVSHKLQLVLGHHGLSPCSTHLGEGIVSLAYAGGPIWTLETTGRTPVAVLDAHPEHRRGTV